MTFECSQREAGATIYHGGSFDCESSNNEIALLHSRFYDDSGTSGACNNGDIVGQSLRVEDNCYTSQLNVTISSNMIGKTVECSHDNGTTTESVGSYLVSIPGENLCEHVCVCTRSFT